VFLILRRFPRGDFSRFSFFLVAFRLSVLPFELRTSLPCVSDEVLPQDRNHSFGALVFLNCRSSQPHEPFDAGRQDWCLRSKTTRPRGPFFFPSIMSTLVIKGFTRGLPGHDTPSSFVFCWWMSTLLLLQALSFPRKYFLIGLSSLLHSSL